jgi:DNA-binding CsgD family transcriptional regulator
VRTRGWKASRARNNMSLKEIAFRLFISQNTVKTHVRYIFKKTGVRTRADIARLLMELDIMDKNHP